MGYTHYWDSVSPFTDAYKNAVVDCIKIIEKSPVPLADGVASKGSKPDCDISDGLVRFNGASPNDYETLDVRPTDGKGWCKTNQKPYDIIVTACLARLAEAGLQVSSDGCRKDWQDGLELAGKVLGRDVPCPEGIRE